LLQHVMVRRSAHRRREPRVGPIAGEAPRERRMVHLTPAC
jgi:hypothetical protein